MPELRLDSWKSIAEYLKRSLRTVQRWHACQGLPVHHFDGRKGSVFAYAQEIDRWLLSLGQDSGTAPPGKDAALEAGKARSLQLAAHAQTMWETRSEENLNSIAGLYRKAAGQDPNNAGALVGLANTMIAAALEGAIDSAIAYPCAMDALRRAEQIDTHRKQAQCTAAWLDLVHLHNWRGVQSGFAAALRSQPQCSFALSGTALLRIVEGNARQASQYAVAAWKQNPFSSSLGALLCWVHYLAGDFEQTLHLSAQLKATGGRQAAIAAVEALALVQAGPFAANIERIESNARDFPQNQILQGALGYTFAISGRSAAARQINFKMEQMSGLKSRSSPYALALILIGLGQGQEAVPWLEASYEEGSLWSLGFRSDPILRQLNGIPRFQSLLRRIGPAAADRARTASPLALVARAV